MELELTRGQKTVVDDADYDLVRGHKWHALHSRGSFYAARFEYNDGKQTIVLMHRLLLAAPKGMIVDHIDHDTLNNRRSNIRLCTHAQNMQNSKDRASSKTGLRNIRQEKTASGRLRWRACIKVNGKRVHKYFPDAQSATAWAEVMRAQLHGEFAYSQEQDVR